MPFASTSLAARIEAAEFNLLVAGCDGAVVVTRPGSKPPENVEGQGFSLLGAPAILVKAP